MRKPGSIIQRVNPLALLWLAFVAVLVFFIMRVQTYVSGQDPYAYMQIAQALIYRPDGWKAAVTEWLKYGPGWTATLASVRWALGPVAAYWVAPVAFVVLQLLVFRFLLRIVEEPARAFCATCFTAWVMLTGFVMSPYFLLYPFRGTFCYLLAFCGILLTGDRASWRSTLVAALFFGYAILVRETMIFVCGAVFLFLLTAKSSAKGRRLLAFAGPFLLPVLLFGLAAAVTGFVGTEQFGLWWKHLVKRYDAGVWAWVAKVAGGMRAYCTEATGWWGAALLLIGLLRYGKNRSFALLLLLPALLLFVFYALYDVAHRRYVLSILMFAVPAAGCGLVFLVERLGVWMRLPVAWRPWCFHLLSVGWIGLLGFKASAMLPLWNVDVDRAQARDLREQLATFADPEDGMSTGWYFSYIGEGIAGQTSHPMLLHPDKIDTWLAAGKSCFFLKPLDVKAVTYKPRPYFQVPFENLLRHRCQLVPVMKADGSKQTVTFIGFPYQVFELQPWAAGTVRQEVKPVARDDRYLWLDFGRDRGDRDVVVVPREGPPLRYALESVTGYVILALPEDAARQPFTLEVASRVPVSPAPIYGFQLKDRFAKFDLRNNRKLSVDDWFPRPFLQRSSPAIRRNAAQLHTDEATILLPPIYGEVAETMEVMLTIGLYPTAEGAGTLSFHVGEEALFRTAFDMSRYETRYYLTVPVRAKARTPLTMRVEVEGAPESSIRIYSMGLRLPGS